MSSLSHDPPSLAPLDTPHGASPHRDQSEPAAPPPELAPLTRMEKLLTLFVPLFLVISALGVWCCVRQLEGVAEWIVFVAALPTAWALADALTGVVHWVLDTYGSEDTPVVGYVLIKPFRMHHDYPTYMVQYDDALTIANSAAGATPVQLGALYVATWGGWWSVLALLVLIMMFGAVATNLFHKWAHMDEPPYVAAILQRCRIILTVAHHDQHHEAPHKSGYCITNGWMNPLLDAMNFWRGLEWVLARCGVHPHEDTLHSSLQE